MYAHVMPHLTLISRHKSLVSVLRLSLVLSIRSFHFILFIPILALVTKPISSCSLHRIRIFLLPGFCSHRNETLLQTILYFQAKL